jgi:regulator of chromosome condensation
MSRHSLEASLTPRPINFKPYKRTAKFVAVNSGSYHTILTHENQELYSFGLNNYGQLGLGDTEEHDIPDLMEGLPADQKIKMIGGGEHFTVVLLESGILLLDSGEVYVCGRNDSGQLGLPSSEFPEHLSTLRKLALPKIKTISCGAAFSLAVTEANDLYAWGYGEMGQLANEEQDAPTPFQVELKGRTVLYASGGGQHSVLLLAPKE